MSKEVNTVEVVALRKVLQKFNGDLGTHMNDEKRYLLGRVLTIIDASIADTEQRKAIKDLVNNEWWSGSGMRPVGESQMQNPHSDIRGLCKALGFELYEPLENVEPQGALLNDSEWESKKYKKELQD